MHNGIIHVYSYGLFSHTRRRQNSPIRKWTNINIFFTDITAFRLSTCPNVCGSHLFVSKQNGEINWTWFYVQRFTVWNILRCLFWWTSHHCSWPKHWTFPPTKLGSERGGKRSWEGKQKFSHPQFCELPAHPPHVLDRKRCTKTLIDYMSSFFWTSLTCCHQMFHFGHRMQHALWVELTRFHKMFTNALFVVSFKKFGFTHSYIFFEETLLHRCPLDYKQISASWHKA